MDVSFDIETFATGPYARIFQIGAVAFESHEMEQGMDMLQDSGRLFNVFLIEDTNYHSKTETDPDTLFWWKQQKEAYESILMSARPLSPERAMREFSEFLGLYLGNNACLWAKPPAFDCNILRDSYHALKMPVPWHYRQEACVRTILRLAQRLRGDKWKAPDLSTIGLVAHNGLHDAVEQAVLVQSAMQALRSAP